MVVGELGERGMSRKSESSICIVPLLTSPASSADGTASPLPMPSLKPGQPEVVTGWQEQILAAFAAVEARQFEVARKQVNGTIDEMVRLVKRGEAARLMLGSAIFVRALAESGLGESEDANWDWEEALAIEPGLALLDLDSYGEVASDLGRPAADQTATRWKKERKLPDPLGEITPPKKISAPQPDYPPGKRIAGIAELIVIQAVVGTDGTTRNPSASTEDDPLLVYAALEALRHWTFEPARLEGEPVAVYWNLTVNFKLGGCGPGPDRAQRSRKRKDRH